MLKVMVAVKDLGKGMYISELDRPWLGSPFIFQGFRITNVEELQQLKETCEYVYVDKEKSIVSLPQKTVAWATEKNAAKINNIKNVRLANSPLTYHASFDDELPLAWDAYEETLSCITEVLADARLGKNIHSDSIKSTVNFLADSVIRNPDALMLLSSLKEKGDFTITHAINTCIFSLIFGRYIGMKEPQLKELGVGALLHDIGETMVPTELLLKEGDRSPAEYKIMCSHVAEGVKILTKAEKLPQSAISIAGNHHERTDGSGYPNKLADKQIDFLTKVVSVVDIYDTLTSGLYGRPAITCALALKHMYSWRKELFDCQLVEKFIQCLGIYPIGSIVEFRSGEVGIVITVEPKMRLTPKVLLVRDENKQPMLPTKLVNLALFQNSDSEDRYKISRVVEPERYDIDTRGYVIRDLQISLAGTRAHT